MEIAVIAILSIVALASIAVGAFVAATALAAVGAVNARLLKALAEAHDTIVTPAHDQSERVKAKSHAPATISRQTVIDALRTPEDAIRAVQGNPTLVSGGHRI